MINEKAIDALPVDLRKALVDALPAYVVALRKGTYEGATNGRQWLIKEGMTAVPVSPEDRAIMQKAAVVVIDNWQKRLDPEAHKIYEKVKAMIDEYNAKKK